jgi:hypothetical protein
MGMHPKMVIVILPFDNMLAFVQSSSSN